LGALWYAEAVSLTRGAPLNRPTVPGGPPQAADAAYLAAIVATSDDAIIAKDLEGRITAWNPAAERLFGYPSEDALGRHISILFPEDRLPEEAEIMDRVLRGESVEHFETERRRKDGGTVSVSLTVSPILGADGAIIGASKIARDIGARLRSEERLRELQQELVHLSRLSDMGQMASAIAHELNQPLSSAAIYASGVRRLLDADEPQVALALDGLGRAVEQIQRAGDIVRRLRAFVERGETERRLEPLPPVVEEALRLLGPTLRAQCEVSFSSEPDLPLVLIDRVQIQQVLLNLFRNAIEAMADRNPRLLIVEVRPTEGEEHLRVTVADTGPGIAPEVAARLFQPFVTSKSAGMGVGLSICRTIMDAHGGDIAAAPRPGGGALFTLTLPVVDDADEPAEES
jgi:two-component system sensor kinase FixL